MKINKYFIPALLSPLMIVGCADWDDWNYDVEKPQTITQYEYLNGYAPLKENLDRNAHPGFKVGGALGAAEFSAQGPLFRLAAHNFDEIVAGNAMKMASCVNDQGNMDFGTVASFVQAAEDAGVTVYGHTLAWHSQQPKKWLEKLLADKELDIDPNEKIEREVKTQSFAGLTKFPFYVMGYEPQIIDGVLTSHNPDGWHQYFVIDGLGGLEEGQTYKVTAMIRASKEHTINVQFGNWGNLAEAKMKIGTEWKECSVEFVCPPVTSGFSVFQPGVFDGTIEIQWVKVSKLETPAMEVEKEVRYHTYTDGPFPYYQMGCAPDVIDGSIHFIPTGAWSQFFCLPGGENPLSPGEYAVYVEIKSSKAGSIKLTVQNGWGGDAENFTGNVALKEGWTTSSFRMKLEQGGNYDMILKPETFDAVLDLKSITIKQIVKMNSIPLTDEEKKDTLVWAMNKWVDGMMQATKGKVQAWDLINEAVSGGGSVNGFYALQSASNVSADDAANCFYWQDYFSPEDYGPIVEKAARDAYAAVEGTNPADLKLFINDYNLESDWDNNHKVKSLVYWIGVWEKRGQELGYNTKIDGIGSQMHISYYENPQTLESKKRAITNSLKIMAETGRLVRISELDMGYVDAEGKSLSAEAIEALPLDERMAKEKAMADYYQWIIRQYFEIVPVAQQYGITQWCITDAPASSGWRNGEPVGLWNLNYQRKPAYGGFADGLSGK
ncbi:MAG: endo-1,4-beta-xylanase [Prevotella sp.]